MSLNINVFSNASYKALCMSETWQYFTVNLLLRKIVVNPKYNVLCKSLFIFQGSFYDGDVCFCLVYMSKRNLRQCTVKLE